MPQQVSFVLPVMLVPSGTVHPQTDVPDDALPSSLRFFADVSNAENAEPKRSTETTRSTSDCLQWAISERTGEHLRLADAQNQERRLGLNRRRFEGETDGGCSVAVGITICQRDGGLPPPPFLSPAVGPACHRPPLPPHPQASHTHITSATAELCWTGMFSDPHTGVAAYAVTVTADAAPVAQFADLRAECVRLTHGLASGARVDVAVVATNPAGLSTTATAALQVDLSAPQPPAHFYYGTASAPVAAQTSARSFSAEWTPFREPESAPVATAVCLGTAPGQCDLRRDRVGNATAVRYDALPAAAGARVYLALETCNTVGLCLSWAPAAPLIIDDAAPTVTVRVAGPRPPRRRV